MEGLRRTGRLEGATGWVNCDDRTAYMRVRAISYCRER